MALEQRFYSSDIGEGIDPVTGEVVTAPLVLLHPVAWRGFSARGADQFLIVADEAEWAAFDAEFPNQGATTGKPHRRRRPTTDLPYLRVME